MRKAFSLVEIIIILFIISMGMLGVLSLIIQNIQSQTYNKNNLIAFQLAQEGIELVRMVRDSNWRNGEAYTAGLPEGRLYMDFEDLEPTVFSGNTVDFLLRLGADGFYRHGGTDPSSSFSREIDLDLLNANSLQVDVHISWQERGRDMNYDLQTILYNWQ